MFYVPARDYIRPKLVVVFVKKISAVCTRKIARRVCYYIRTPHKVLASQQPQHSRKKHITLTVVLEYHNNCFTSLLLGG